MFFSGDNILSMWSQKDSKQLRGTEKGDVLKLYLDKYFQDLTSTQHNILFDLPQFNDSLGDKDPQYLGKHRPTHQFTPMGEYPGDSLETECINKWIISQWKPPKITEHSSFKLVFGRPNIEPLFEDVVVLTVNLSSITFFDTK